MKNSLKLFLSRKGLFYTLDLCRQLPQIITWLKKGCSGVAPQTVKRIVINAYLKKYKIAYFVETGTYLGDTLAYVAYNKKIHAISIELSDHLYQTAKRRFARYSNVTILHGDSGRLMAQVIASLCSPALFWLDAHYSGGITSKSDLDTPVINEIKTILSSSVNGHVILIDDMHCFDGRGGYPHLDELLALIRADGRYDVEISTDILRMTPKQPPWQ